MFVTCMIAMQPEWNRLDTLPLQNHDSIQPDFLNLKYVILDNGIVAKKGTEFIELFLEVSGRCISNSFYRVLFEQVN